MNRLVFSIGIDFVAEKQNRPPKRTTADRSIFSRKCQSPGIRKMSVFIDKRSIFILKEPLTFSISFALYN